MRITTITLDLDKFEDTLRNLACDPLRPARSPLTGLIDAVTRQQPDKDRCFTRDLYRFQSDCTHEERAVILHALSVSALRDAYRFDD